jgi:quercetin dioxygenase-like cupin family protein
MSIPHAHPGTPVNLRPEEESLSEARSAALVKNDAFEAIRLVVPKGHEMRRHQVEGSITVYCIAGRVAFHDGDAVHDLKAGHWLYLPGGAPHSLSGIEDSAVLLTIMFPRK